MSRSIWVCARILFTLHVCAAGSYGQCPNDGVDCNKNKMSDACEIEKRLSLDCNANGVPDECDVTDGGMLDCNANLVPDACEIRAATPLIRESFAAESINTSTWPIVADMTIDTDFPRAIGYSARFDSASSQLVSRQIDLEGALWANLDFLIYGQQPVLVFFRTQDQWTHVPAQPLFVSEGHRYDISIPMQFHATTAQVRIRPANVNNFMPFMIDEITLTRYEPDCNENSVIDRCDAELVEDCNNNDVPDTCDLESPRWERHWHPGIWKSHTHLAAADLNLDGHMDLVTSNVIPSRNVSIWWNEGDNQFTEMVVTETASGSTVGSSRFIIANVTNDPFPDIVSSSDGDLYIASNTNGTVDSWELLLDFENLTYATGIDVNNDGNDEIVVNSAFATENGDTDLIVIFDGMLRSARDEGPDFVTAILAEDFDQDGLNDVLVERSSVMNFQLNQGLNQDDLWIGFDQSTVTVEVNANMAKSKTITADFNFDGWPDLAYTNYDPIGFPDDEGTLIIQINQRQDDKGNWLGFQQLEGPQVDFRASSIATFSTNHGHTDILVGSFSSQFGTIVRYGNMGLTEDETWQGFQVIDRIFNYRQFPNHDEWGPGIHDLVAVDLNNDGLNDIALVADDDLEDGRGLSTIIRVQPHSQDCNANQIADDCETESDINGNLVPDSCEPDCNKNNLPDSYDIDIDTSTDCNHNDIPDECDIADATSEDCDENQLPDECEYSFSEVNDCNANDILDACDFIAGNIEDCNENQQDDTCEPLGLLSFDEWVDGSQFGATETILRVSAPYPQGYLVSDFYSEEAAVMHITPDGRTLTPFASQPQYAVSIEHVPAAFDPLGGRVYAARQVQSPTIFAINPDGSLEPRFDMSTHFNAVIGLTYIEEGRGTPFDNHLLVSGQGNEHPGLVVALSANGDRQVVATPPSQLWTCTLAPDGFGSHGGKLFVGAESRRDIYAIDLETSDVELFRTIDFFPGTIDGMRMLAFSPVGWAKFINRRFIDQRVLVAGYTAPHVFGQPPSGLMIFDQEGFLVQWISKTPDGQTFDPRGILFEEGRLLVADIRGGIFEVAIDHRDCDADLQPDDCAIATDQSLDRNNNGRIDVCENLGDVDGDGRSRLSDWSILQSCFGDSRVELLSPCSLVDMNRDREISDADHIIWWRSIDRAQ